MEANFQNEKLKRFITSFKSHLAQTLVYFCKLSPSTLLAGKDTFLTDDTGEGKNDFLIDHLDHSSIFFSLNIIRSS